MLSGSGYSSAPYDIWAATPEAYKFSSRIEDLEELRIRINESSNSPNKNSDLRNIQRQINSIQEQNNEAFRSWHSEIKPQNPAMAQRQAPRPYDARTDQSMGDTQLNQVYRNDAAMYRQMGGATDPRTIAQNPYLINTQDKAFYDYNQAIKKALSRF
jgi:hypothetical protein